MGSASELDLISKAVPMIVLSNVNYTIVNNKRSDWLKVVIRQILSKMLKIYSNENQ